jgi:hypothetical protein
MDVEKCTYNIGEAVQVRTDSLNPLKPSLRGQEGYVAGEKFALWGTPRYWVYLWGLCEHKLIFGYDLQASG